MAIIRVECLFCGADVPFVFKGGSEFVTRIRAARCHSCSSARQESVESPGTDKQHLQAEIDSCIPELEIAFNDGDEDSYEKVLNKLRQLSAMQ